MIINKLTIRKANSADAAGVSGALKVAFAEYKSFYTPQGFIATTPEPDSVLQRLKDGPVWVAVLNDEIVGTVSAVMREDAVLYMRGMAVLPDARGLGVGELLFAEVRRYGKRQNCSRILLSTTPFLHRAIKLYTRLGFVRTEDGPRQLYGTPLLSMEMKF